MASAIIVYGSTTGNTRFMAETIGKVLNKECTQDSKITLVDAATVSPQGLGDGYDMIIFGSSTWGSDTIEFQKDFASLFENFDKMKLKNKMAAVFGAGDSGYTYFCGAVSEINRKLKELGANVIGGKLMIDGDPHMQKETIVSWAQGLAAALRGETWRTHAPAKDGDQFVMHDKELTKRQKQWDNMSKAGQNVRQGDGESAPTPVDNRLRGMDAGNLKATKSKGQTAVQQKKQPRT